ncbi:MAG: hypothetical protein HWN81_03815 [Candidatus Lokiarchaeota archaeon]|nr:hypothetical protein [Candidatus Lokiarchaeota archaeon]
MGLDKWLKPEDESKKTKKKNESPNQTIKSKIKDTQKPLEKPSIQLTRYILICPNAKCKYQKRIMKKELTDDDITCPRCNKKMKTKVG